MIYNYTFGILSAFGIIFVVLGHVDTNILTFDGWLPYYSFHMQLFMFISGYFFKKSDVNNLVKYVGKKIKRLLIPFYIWNFVYLLVNTILKMFPPINGTISYGMGNTISFYHMFLAPWVEDQPIGFHVSTWFMIALFLVEMYNLALQWICSKLKIANEWIMLAFTLLIAVMGWFFINHGAMGFGKIACRSMYCLFFFRLGQWYKEIGEDRDTVNSSIYFVILILAQTVIRVVYDDLAIGVYGCVNFEHLPMLLILPIIGIAFWLRVAKILTPILQNVTWFIYLGKNTMHVMIHHLFAIFIMQSVIAFVHCKLFEIPRFDLASYASWVYYLYAPNSSLRLLFAILSIAMVLIAVYIKEHKFIFRGQ